MTTPEPNWDISKEDLSWIELTAVNQPTWSGETYSAVDEIDPTKWYRQEDQLSLGACQGFALSGVGEFAYRVATNRVIQFSPMWCFIESQRRGGLLGHHMNGSRLTDGLWVGKNLGFAPESAWRYTGVYDTRRPAGALEAAAPYKIRSHSVLRSYDEIRDYLATNQGGVWIGCNSNGFHPNQPGRLSHFRSGGRYGHSTAFLGFNREGWLWMWNSGYPAPGWYLASPDWVNGMLRDRGSIAIGASDLSTPEPRKFDWKKQSVLA